MLKQQQQKIKTASPRPNMAKSSVQYQTKCTELFFFLICSFLQGSPQKASLHDMFGNCFLLHVLPDATRAQTCGLRVTRLQD